MLHAVVFIVFHYSVLTGTSGRARHLLTNHVPGEHGPEQFYLRYGFKPAGAMRGNGTEPELKLNL